MGETLICLIYPVWWAYCLTNSQEIKSTDLFSAYSETDMGPLTLEETKMFELFTTFPSPNGVRPLKQPWFVISSSWLVNASHHTRMGYDWTSQRAALWDSPYAQGHRPCIFYNQQIVFPSSPVCDTVGDACLRRTAWIPYAARIYDEWNRHGAINTSVSLQRHPAFAEFPSPNGVRPLTQRANRYIRRNYLDKFPSPNGVRPLTRGRRQRCCRRPSVSVP